MNRAVFQRNLQNEAEIPISGSLSRKAEFVQARFTPINGQGFDDGTWYTIQSNANQGFFFGKVRVRGGWYRLEVRAYTNGQFESAKIDKVGVGEVFIISGQSNARGISGRGEKGANDDRVNCVNNLNLLNSFESISTELTISQLSQNANIAPTGHGAWCWGELGDKLAQRLNVPILFFNSGWNGTMSLNWNQSSQRQFTWDAIFQTFFPYLYPYQNLRYSLNYFASLFGVRAVLWQQGEGDVDPGVPNREEGYNNIKTLIEQSRRDFGANMAWMITKTSYVHGKTSDIVLTYQQDIINTPGLNVFQGPFTDNIQIPRPDGIHFANTFNSNGLSDLADAWNQSLNDFFFSVANPVTSQAIVNLDLSCQSNNQVKLRPPGGYSMLKWNDGSQDAEKNTNNREFFGLVRDSVGNIHYTPAVNAAAIDFNLETPQITASKTEICANEEIILTADKNYERYVWNDGTVSSNQRTVNQANTYLVRGVNAVGCWSNTSNQFSLRVNPIPDKPKIINQNKDLVCDGEKITLESSDKINSISWSNGSNERSIQLSQVGDYELQTTSKNQFGCENKSDLKRVSIKPNPVKPRIIAKDPLMVCEGKPVRLVSSDSLNKVVWTNNLNTREIEFMKVGEYSVSVLSENQFGCKSPLADSVKVSIKLRPVKPQLSLEGIFVLRITTQDASKVDFYEWFLDGKKIAQTKDFYYARQSGNYQVWSVFNYKTADNQIFSCNSFLSEPLNLQPDPSLKEIEFYPNPTKDYVYLESRQDLSNSKLTVHHLDGKCIDSFDLPTQNSRILIDLSKYPRGRYLFSVKNANFEASKMIIIE